MKVEAKCCRRPGGGCVRSVYFTEHETDIGDTEDQLHYSRTCKEFYQNINKTGSQTLPRRVTGRPWDCLKSVVQVVNQELARRFEETKQKFLREHKGGLARTKNHIQI